MRDSLLRFSNTGADLKKTVYLLPGQAMLIGIFSGSFDITAHSMFLSFFDEKMMARAYIFSGIAGLILSFVYSGLYKRIPFKKIPAISLLFVSAVTLVLWISLLIKPATPVIFILFIMMGPLNILAMLSLDGSLDHLPENDKAGAISSFTGAGLITGIATGCFSVPLLIPLLNGLRHFIFIGFLAMLGATVIQLFLGRILIEGNHNKKLTDSPQYNDSALMILLQNRLYRMIIVVTIFSVITAFFVQYSFLAVTRIHYPSMEAMAHFFGLFTGVVMVFALITRFFGFPFLVRNFKLQATILLYPLMIAVLTIATVATGYITGNDPSTAVITGFFILLALSRLFSRSLKEAVELPSAKIVFRMLPRNMRFIGWTGMRGLVNETGAAIAGLMLTGLGIIGSVKLIHFPLVLLILTILLIISALRLYSVYRDNVTEKNKENSDTHNSVNQKLPVWENRVSAEMEFTGDYYNLVTGDTGIQGKYQNHWYLNKILDYAGIKKDINLLPALKKIRSGSGIPKETKVRASEIISDLELLLSGVRYRDERLKAMMLLSEARSPQITEVLKLLRSKDNDLKVISLSMIRKFRLNGLLPEVCSCLNDNYIAIQAENVLRSFGSEPDQHLRRFYLLSSDNPRISSTILRLLGENCSSENTELLFSLLWTAARSVREAALKSLARCNYNISREDKEKLLRLLNDVIGIITWNLSAGITISSSDNRTLSNAISQENRRWMDFLFNLLAVTYGNRAAKEIRENIEEGSFQSVNHALGMIDILADEQVKSRLTVLLDRMPVHRKLRTLFRFYTGGIPAWNDLVSDIINRDYNMLGVWIRACIIRKIPEITGDMAESLIALLFSPELILREETAKLLSRSGRGYYMQASDRLPGKVKESLDRIFSGDVKDYELLYEKVIFLKNLFNDLAEESLLFLAGFLISTDFLSPEYLPHENGYIMWECNSGIDNCTARIYYDNILKGISAMRNDTFCYILPLVDLEEYLNRYPEYTPVIFKYIDEIERRK